MLFDQATRELPNPTISPFELTHPVDGEALDLLAVFGRSAPLEVDLGCGDGALLTHLAAQYPERNFLGIEQMAGRVRSACKKIARHELTNARILRAELAYAVEQLLPPESVSTFYLMFPDPWPKRRHHRKRIVTERWLQSIARTLTVEGGFRIATDHEDYFQWMQRVVMQSAHFELEEWLNLEPLPISTFEARYVEQQLTIHRLSLRKVSPGK